MTKWDNLTNKISLRIKNSRQAGLKTHFKAIPKKLRNRKQIEMQVQNQIKLKCGTPPEQMQSHNMSGMYEQISGKFDLRSKTQPNQLGLT